MREVATFVSPVNQFEGGETAYACVAFSAALVFYSTAPGTPNTYNAEEVDKLADYWYAKEEGGFSSSNTNGMGMNELHTMLDGMNLKWQDLGVTANSQHDEDIASVKVALGKGYPVLICGAETGFKYAGSEAVPYSWPPSGNHAIVATTIFPSGNLGVRDMAALAHGNAPGTLQEYDNNAMFLISATAIIPHWIGETPVPNPNERAAFEKEWTSILPDVSLTSGIANAAWADYQLSKFHGPALTHEIAAKNWNGHDIVLQVTPGGRYEWDGAPHFYPYH